MKYEDFERIIQENESQHIKLISLPQSCSLSQIPSNFAIFLGDIVKLVEKHFLELARSKPYIGIFGLQLTSLLVKSTVPLNKNRVFLQNSQESHLCCSLSYLPITESELNYVKNSNDWSGSDNVVIDFTRGLVMSKERYIAELFKGTKKGRVYGKLDTHKLKLLWRDYNEQTQKLAA